MTRTGWLAAIAALVLAGVGGWVLRGSAPTPVVMVDEHDHAEDVDYYTCPMHPSVKAQEPGACPICGMDLTPVPKLRTEAGQGEDGIASVPGMSAPGSRPRVDFIKVTPYQQQLIGVTVGEVTEQSAKTEVRTIGRVVYDETRLTDVNLKVSGWIQDLYVDHVGKSVRKGEPLFTLYSPELVASQEEYLLAYEGLRRVQAPALQDSESPEGESAVWSERLLQSARERLELWDLTDRQIRELESTGKRSRAVTVYAPSDGIVTERMAVSGMFVKPDMRLYRIARLDSVWIRVDVYEQELPFVHAGQPATISLSYLPEASLEGTVDYVYPYLDPKTLTATVRVRVSNPDGALKPGMFANVLLHRSEDTRLLVPEAAVLFSGRRRIVFLALGDGRFQPREVSLGRQFRSGYEVIAGLRSGDRVVTSANFLLDSESKLKNVTAAVLPTES